MNRPLALLCIALIAVSGEAHTQQPPTPMSGDQFVATRSGTDTVMIRHLLDEVARLTSALEAAKAEAKPAAPTAPPAATPAPPPPPASPEPDPNVP